jgi:ABC-type arginine transport system permease subunit
LTRHGGGIAPVATASAAQQFRWVFIAAALFLAAALVAVAAIEERPLRGPAARGQAKAAE